MVEISQAVIRERERVPREPEIARANFLALQWSKPISDLVTDGVVLPGIHERFLPEDHTQTLGHFLTGGDENLGDFESFKRALDNKDYTKVASVLQEFKNICPSPQELFEQNPQLLNWVPWEAFIAYGDVLSSQAPEIDASGEDVVVAKVVAGEPYLSAMQEHFPRGFPRKRTEVTLERQNKDPKTQGILEGISNSIDAVSEREAIGRVKQVFTWLERGKGEVTVLAVTVNNTRIIRSSN